jgi:hypothetical protein
MSFVGSIELFLDPVLDDPRLGLGIDPGPPPLRGVRLSMDMTGKLKEMRRRGVFAGEMRREGKEREDRGAG